MGNSAPATIYSNTLYSDSVLAFDPDARAEPTRADVVTAAAYRDTLRRDPPGGSTDNRWRQVRQGYRGVPYVAIRAIMDLVGGASACVMKRKYNPRGRVLFGPGGFVKSLALGQQQGRDEDYVPLDDYDHPAARLVRRPNPNESFGEFAAKVVLQNRLTGIGPVWKIGSKLSPEKPVELWALRTPLMYPLYQGAPHYPRGAWRIQPARGPGWLGTLPAGLGANGALIPGEDVARFVDPHPEYDWDGWSPLTAGSTQLDVFEAVEQSRKSAMDRGVNLDVVVTAPGAKPEAVERMTARLEDRHMGAEKARRVAVFAPELPEGFAVTTLGAAAKDMDYPTGWEQGLKFVLALFGVPPIIAGLGEAASYAAEYAAVQQFYRRQENYLNRLATWFDRAFLNPWEEYEGELTLKIKPQPIDDKELREKQHQRQCQFGTITHNESRAKDDLPPVEGGDVPTELYNQWLAKKIMPEPEPDPTAAMLGGGQSGELSGGADDDGADVPDEMLAAALDELGVPGGGVQKAQWDEGKHKRDHGKFSSTGGASGAGKPHELTQIGNLGRGIADSFYDGLQDSLAKTGDVPATERRGNTKIAQAWDLVKKAGLHNHPEAAGRFAAAVREAYNSGGSGRDWTDALNKHFAGARPGTGEKVAAAKEGGTPAATSPRAAGVARRAKSSPAVKDQLARAHEWADQMAERHADRVAKHLGIDRASAKHVLASTIKMLCERALRGEGDDQSKTFAGAGGQKLTIGVKKKQFAGGGENGPPRPDNPMGAGSLAPRKAMSALLDSAGGALVRPPQQGRRMRRRKGVRAVVARVLKSLED